MNTSSTSVSGLVSVIVPVFNIAEYLPQCLDSLLAQTYSNIEIICVNDGSHDDSGKICDAYAEQDHRIRVIHKGNEGVSVARNAAIKVAKGEFITLVDGDDWLEQNTLEVCMDYVAKYPEVDFIEYGCIDIVHGRKLTFIPYNNENQILIDSRGGGGVLMSYVYRSLPSSLAGAKFFRVSTMHGLTYPEGRYYEDEIFAFNLSLKSSLFIYIGLPLYNYRRNRPGSAMFDGFTKRIAHMFENMTLLRAEMELLDSSPIAEKFPYPLSMYANTMLLHKLIFYAHKFHKEEDPEMRSWLAELVTKYAKEAKAKPYIALSLFDRLKKIVFLSAPHAYIRFKNLIGRGENI